MDDWCELFANQTTRKRARRAEMQGSERIASRLKIATPGEYFVIDMGWLMDDPLPVPGPSREPPISWDCRACARLSDLILCPLRSASLACERQSLCPFTRLDNHMASLPPARAGSKVSKAMSS